MSTDFLRSCEIADDAHPDAHHPECSYSLEEGVYLCDPGCPVMAGHPEDGCAALHGMGGAVLLGACSCALRPPPVPVPCAIDDRRLP